jgi:hypothetical protein
LAAGPRLDREVARALGVDASAAVPPYSTNDDIAVALAEWFSREWGCWEYVKLELDGAWTVGWIEEKQPLHHSMRPVQSTAPTRALATCRSILKLTKARGDRATGPHSLPPGC